RQLQTRVDILTRIAVIVIGLVALGAMLMTFPTIRALGTTLLASAGLIGIVAGIAARPFFENMVAGLQLAFTQPIRLDDVVVINGYWGKIEEIHMTYVVIQVWDLRRLVVPLSWFINNPFENWTRRTANLLGEVHVFADPTMDVAALRAEIPKIVQRSPLWDGNVQNCQVVDASPQSLDVRVLVSARNSGDLFDLRCFTREAIYAYLREHQPEAFPRTRIERIVEPDVAPEPYQGVGATTGAVTADGRSAPAVRTIKEG
ncbi:MAG: mechanosensitive ion channel, partial [Candidatus Eremiobacteraeota bacterium]|nr:mechanosensitive ion channel [Candidatus Eremiobacteraeota bacterium]